MKRALSTLTILLLSLASGAAAASLDPPVRNWAVPGISADGRTALSDLGLGPILFMPITPCRLADTRSGSGFSGQWGPPSIAGGGTQRTFTITGQCGIPSGAKAVSFNFAVWGPPTRGDLRVFPAGGGTPLVSTLNWEAGILALANAAVVPLGTGGAITLQVDGAGTVDIFFDVNGYYIGGGIESPINSGEYVGIVGTYNAGGLLYVHNYSTSTNSQTTAVRGQLNSTTDNQSAVWGEQAGFSGANYGVKGTNRSVSPMASGIIGIGGTANWTSTNTSVTGVRGHADGGSYSGGVIGDGTSYGVQGRRVNSSGAYQTFGLVGSSGNDGFYTPNDLTVSGTKAFIEPHPTDPAKIIRFVALEGPESGTYFRGRGRTQNKVGLIDVPEAFRLTTAEEGLSVHITPMGRPTSIGVRSVSLDRIEVESTRDVEFFFIVHGVRKAFRDFKAIEDDLHYFVPQTPEDRLEEKAFTPEFRNRLVATGVYNADGTVNMATAEKMGWAQKWEERAKAAAAPRISAAPSNN